MATAAARYQQLEADRQPALDRAREASRLSIPSLIPPAGSTAATKLPTPWQGVGAAGVISLTAKTLTTSLPPNEPFFRLDIDEFALKELSQNPNLRAEVETALSMVERVVRMTVEAQGLRIGIHEALTHLIVGGNVLIYVDPDKGVRVWGLDRFVVLRDPAGNAIEIIACEEVAVDILPEEIKDAIRTKAAKAPQPSATQVKLETVKLYTWLRRVSATKWEATQWADDFEIAGSRGSYPVDKMPWLALRWNRIDGENYGRGHVETCMGDLQTLEAISKAIAQFAAGAAKVIPLVNPNGVTDEKDLAEAENFEFVAGVASDVSFLRIDKYADLQVAKQFADDLTRRLEMHFLMNRSIQRAGERVTAEEIRYMAVDLEATLGGVYALLAQELQLPLVTILMAQLTKAKRLPPLPKGLVKPSITTGLDALSRANDLVKLDRFAAGLRDLYGPEALAAETNIGDYVKRRGAALGIDTTGLIKSDEQKKAEAEARAQQEMMARLGPQTIQQMGGLAQKSMETSQ